jgi:hypothetical protein
MDPASADQGTAKPSLGLSVNCEHTRLKNDACRVDQNQTSVETISNTVYFRTISVAELSQRKMPVYRKA